MDIKEWERPNKLKDALRLISLILLVAVVNLLLLAAAVWVVVKVLKLMGVLV